MIRDRVPSAFAQATPLAAQPRIRRIEGYTGFLTAVKAWFGSQVLAKTVRNFGLVLTASWLAVRLRLAAWSGVKDEVARIGRPLVTQFEARVG